MSKKLSKNIEVAQEILKIIENNSGEWEKTWDFSKTGICCNASTSKPYKGLNFIMLLASIKKNNFKDGRFLTFAQAKKLGGHPKAGIKATTLIYYADYDKKTKKPYDKQVLIDEGKTPSEIYEYEKENVYTYAKPFWVFNVEQCENLKLPELKKLSQQEMKIRTNKVVEEIIKKSQAPIYNDGGDHAYYLLDEDTIHTPERSIFNSMDDYYATVLHEIAHSTGNKNRLNRNLAGEFGSKEYAAEECIAEFAALMLQNQAGINLTGKPIQNHASYIKNWLKRVEDKDKPYDLVHIISQADKVCQFVMTKYLSKKFLTSLDKKEEKVPEAPIKK